VRWPLLLFAALLVLVLTFLSWAWVRRARLRKRVPAREAPKLRHAVVLAHGILGFDEVVFAGRRHRYFRNISERLAAPGADFHRPGLPPRAPVPVRAEKLVALLRELPGERINVIAHSMGGLDARYAITRLGLAERVASLVTIGTPHRGTPLANLRLSRMAARLFGLAALNDLTPRALERFNREVPDADGVAYFSVVASTGLLHTNPLLWPAHLYLSARCGPNDGIVPASSQRWGKVLREVEADHWAQVGWSLRFDAVALYEQVLRDLAALGF
jgi:triacylglycerol lipase